MRAAKRAGPRQAVSRDGLVTAVRPLRTVTTSIEPTEAETCTSRRSIAIGVRGEASSRALSGQERPARRPRIRHEQRFPCVHETTVACNDCLRGFREDRVGIGDDQYGPARRRQPGGERRCAVRPADGRARAHERRAEPRPRRHSASPHEPERSRSRMTKRSARQRSSSPRRRVARATRSAWRSRSRRPPRRRA